MTIAAPTAVSGLYSGGPADPGVPNVTTDANGKPTSLGYYGSPGTAVITQFASGSGWILGRFGNGTFGTGGSSGTLTYGPNDAAHFVVQSQTTALPTTGTAQYSVTAATEPTFPGGARSFDDPTTIINLGVSFGTAPKFGYDGTISGLINGATAASVSFSTAGGSAAPSLTNAFLQSGNLSLFGTAPVTAVTSNLCASAADCKLNANFISGGAGAATYGVAWGLVGTSNNVSILNGAALLSRATAMATPTPTPTATAQTFRAYDPVVAGSIDPATIAAGSDGKLESFAGTTGGTYLRGTTTNHESGAVTGVLGWTRWSGGTSAGASSVAIPENGGGGYIWGTPATAIPTAGNANYVLIGSTTPTFSDGSIAPGVVRSAALSVSFASRLAGLSAVIGINGIDYGLSSSGGTAAPSMAFESNGYGFSARGGTAVVDGNGCNATSCSARISGFLAGAGASNAGIAYIFSSGAGSVPTISGTLAFGQSPTATTPTATTVSADVYHSRSPVFTGNAVLSSVTVDPATYRATQIDPVGADVFNRGTNTDYEQGGVGSIIGWTRWAGGTTTGSPVRTTGTNGGTSFVYGTHTPTASLPASGAATYTMIGGTAPVSDNGSVSPGTLDRATLLVDFAARKVGFEAGITFGGNAYALTTAGGTAAPSLAFNTVMADFVGNLSATGGSCGTGCAGRVSGFLAGPNATHAGVAYGFQYDSIGGVSVSGVVGLAK